MCITVSRPINNSGTILLVNTVLRTSNNEPYWMVEYCVIIDHMLTWTHSFHVNFQADGFKNGMDAIPDKASATDTEVYKFDKVHWNIVVDFVN